MRIIAGKYKGLKLITFDEDNIRPTLDKVREAIFSKIQFNIKEASFLDLFAGTGAVSLEASSRGALVTSIDKDKRSVRVIKENFMKAKAPLNLFEIDFEKAIQILNGKHFDFIFLDPPFNTGLGVKAIDLIGKRNLLSKDGLIIYEHSVNENFEYNDFEIVDEKKYGTVLVSYLKAKCDLCK